MRPRWRAATRSSSCRPAAASRSATRRRRSSERARDRRRLAAHLADEGPGRRPPASAASPAAQIEQLAVARGRSARSSASCSRGGCKLLFVSPERLAMPGFRDAPAARRTCRRSPSTRRTASATGGTTSAPSTGSSATLRERASPSVAIHAYTATATAQVRARHRRAARAARSGWCWSATSTGRTSPTASCRGATSRSRSSRSSSGTRRGGHRLLHAPQGRRRARRAAPHARLRRARATTPA